VHSLVRSALLAELGRRSAVARVAEQHVRAARWFEDEGEVPAALDHWLLAGRPADALRLLAVSVADLYDSGREATVRRTIGRLPPVLASDDLGAMVELAACYLLFDRQQFVELVEQATWWAERSTPDGPLRGRLTILEAAAAAIGGDFAEGTRLARGAMHELGDVLWRRDRFGRFGWNIIARDMAVSERWDDAGDEVRQGDLALRRDPERHLGFRGTRALGLALAGHPEEALVASAGIRRAAATSDMTFLRDELALAEAIAHRELGDRDLAVPELAELADQPAEATFYCRGRATIELVEAHLDVDDLAGARAVFERAQALVEAEAFGVAGRDWLRRTGTRLALAAGRDDEARCWAEAVEDPFWRAIGLARVHPAADAADAAGADGADGAGGPGGAGHRAGAAASAAAIALRDAVPRCVRHEVVLGLVQARTAPDRDEAARHVAAAVELASANGLLQTVASEGADLVELVERSAWQVPPQWLDRLRRATAGGSIPTDRRPRRRRGAHRPRARRPAAPGQPADRRRDRRRALRVGQHAQVPPQGDLPEARRADEGRDRRGGPPHDRPPPGHLTPIPDPDPRVPGPVGRAGRPDPPAHG
jgi:LuxR family transcriptional regulator, maltose regulon positive regulatory protein